MRKEEKSGTGKRVIDGQCIPKKAGQNKWRLELGVKEPQNRQKKERSTRG